MRAVAGRLPADIEPGVIVGPNYNNELLVSLDTEGPGTEFGYATTRHIEDALALPAPRSVAEARLRDRTARP